jgi:hypothetical protein
VGSRDRDARIGPQAARVRNAMPGVGIGPTSSTSTPIEHSPDASAVSIMYPEMRVSLPMTIL